MNTFIKAMFEHAEKVERSNTYSRSRLRMPSMSRKKTMSKKINGNASESSNRV